MQVTTDGEVVAEPYGKPAPPTPQYQTIVGVLAEGNGRVYVHTGGVWVDAGKEPDDSFFFPVGAKVVVEPIPDEGEDEGTTVRLTPVTLQLQG